MEYQRWTRPVCRANRALKVLGQADSILTTAASRIRLWLA
jgi:hypothetical protein